MAKSLVIHSAKLSSLNINVAASQTNQVISKPCPISYEASMALRVDFIIGKVVGGLACTVGIQTSNGYNIWSSTKTEDVDASTDTSISAASGNSITATSHGLAVGDIVAINGTAIPAGLTLNAPYRVASVTSANVVKIEGMDGAIPVITSSGSSATITKARLFSIQFLPQVAGDQTYMPLQNLIRAVCTTDAAETVQVVDILVQPGIC